jgi:hypothetical protein
MSAGFSHMEMAGDQGIEARRHSCRLRGERGALVSHAFSLQRLVVEQCVTRTIAAVDCHERVGIGAHRVNGVQIGIAGTTWLRTLNPIHVLRRSAVPASLRSAAL